MTQASLSPRASGVRRIAAAMAARREALGLSRATELLALGLIILLVALAVWPFTRAHLQAMAVLDLVGNQPVPAPLRHVVSEPVHIEDVAFASAGHPIRARIYTPVHHPDAPALIVLHGVHHLGMDEPRLIAFASAMASCGIRVLTPELPDIKDYHVGSNSIATIGDAARWMAERNRGAAVGVMGLSFAGGLSLMAAADPAYRQSIRFVVAIGSQDEMTRVAAYYRTGEDQRPDGTRELLPPHEYGALVLEYEHLEDFVQPAGVAGIRAVLRAHLYEDPRAEAYAFARLSDAQKNTARALLDTTSAHTRDLLARAEARHIEDMAGVSPHGHLAQLTTPVYLLHGEGDNIIPAAETEWMASEIPSASLQAELISPVLSHLNLDGHAPSTVDRLRLVHFFALILHATEKQ